jgi:hypothetical protein
VLIREIRGFFAVSGFNSQSPLSAPFAPGVDARSSPTQALVALRGLNRGRGRQEKAGLRGTETGLQEADEVERQA